MIIYDRRKPKNFDGANCVGITGENLAETQEFLIRGMCDITVDYTIHLRFADGSVNSVIPDSTAIDETGTKLVWKVRKNDIFMHGYFELQLEGRGENGYVFQTQIVTLYADESIPIEDKEYLNPNSETLKLREETQKLLDETKLCRTEIDKTKKLIEQSDITKKEDNLNKVSDSSQITDYTQNYPSIKYLEAYYLPASKSYGRDELDGMFAAKADRATTLDGYGITDTYTQSQIKTKLERKLNKMPFDSEPTLNSPCYLTSGAVYNALLAKADKASTLAGYGITDAYTKNAVDTSLANKANLVSSSNIFDFDAWAKGLQEFTNPVYRGTLGKVDYNEKSFAITTTEPRGYTNGWNSSAPQSMRIAVKPNTKYLFSWLPSSKKCEADVFLNGITANRFELKGGFGSFTTAEDTTYILIRFVYYEIGFLEVSEIMIAEKESIYLPNKVAEGVPEVANEVLAFEKTTQTLLANKYDSSNIETGKGELTPAQATYDGCEGSFNYSKIGKTVTVALNITTLVADKNYVQFAGLPFTAMTASKLSSIVAYTTANKLVNIRLHGSWLYISSPGTTFAEGEKINVIVTYIIG
ncbi:hypothetical protein DW802_09680 [Ruminococcus bromii]|jgi:hypothetical protein|nr:hypothetical protein [Ruminococcus bromii]RHD22099.1 hypothetical protein DW802_09680 [Ruminococcus bromii]